MSNIFFQANFWTIPKPQMLVFPSAVFGEAYLFYRVPYDNFSPIVSDVFFLPPGWFKLYLHLASVPIPKRVLYIFACMLIVKLK